MHVQQTDMWTDLLLIVNVISTELLLLSLLLKERILTLLLLCLVRRLEVGIVKLADVNLANLYQCAGGNDIRLHEHSMYESMHDQRDEALFATGSLQPQLHCRCIMSAYILAKRKQQ